MSEINFTCPHCERDVTIATERRTTQWHTNTIKNTDGRHTLVTTYIVCPNPKCKKITLQATLFESSFNSYKEVLSNQIHHWDLIPSSGAKSFPDYIPKAILADYQEACSIKQLSPKASATLSRRCLQGIIRDFWEAKPQTLFKEIESIKENVDPLIWEAIDAVRKVGNIGAHMEKDINIIVDVEPHEANLLINLIETLLKEWYVAREERRARLLAITSIADQKAIGKKQ